MNLPVYLDYNATTPVDPAVVEAMLPYLTQHFGNPASSHAYGTAAEAAVAMARAQAAALLGCRPEELVFTACASESSNLAIKGATLAQRARGRHLITSQVEHPATQNSCRYLAQEFGCTLTELPVDGDGRVDPDALRRALRPDTVLITLIAAQNETGVLQPLAAVGRIAREQGVLFHVDAAQMVGKLPVDVEAIGCDLLSVAGHKLYAPKGIGALYVRQGVALHPLLHGAGYEGGRRAGTLNVPYIVALGKACALAAAALATGEAARIRSLRDRLEAALTAAVGARRNGHPSERLPGTLNLSIPGIVGNDLLAAVPEVAASTGSACHAGISRPSEVLLAMGVDPELARGVLRLSLGRWTTAEEVDFAADRLAAGVRRLRPA